MGFVYLLFLNQAFSQITMSWVFNVRSLQPEILQRIIFIASDYSTARNIAHQVPEITIFTRESLVRGQVTFGSYKYYSVVLERMKVQNMLLQAGISVQIIESDQIWSADITATLSELFKKHLIIAGDESAFHNASRTKRICGGFYGIASTEATRMLFQEYVKEHERILLSQKRKHEHDARLTRFEDDQSRLTRTLRQNSIEVFWHSPCFYANGLWYDTVAFRRRCQNPYVLHNNYIVGSSEKIRRAKDWDHWFLDKPSRPIC